jgi:hypothetical protein
VACIEHPFDTACCICYEVRVLCSCTVDCTRVLRTVYRALCTACCVFCSCTMKCALDTVVCITYALSSMSILYYEVCTGVLFAVCCAPQYIFGYVGVRASFCVRCTVCAVLSCVPSPISNDCLLSWCTCCCVSVSLSCCLTSFTPPLPTSPTNPPSQLELPSNIPPLQRDSHLSCTSSAARRRIGPPKVLMTGRCVYICVCVFGLFFCFFFELSQTRSDGTSIWSTGCWTPTKVRTALRLLLLVSLVPSSAC